MNENQEENQKKIGTKRSDYGYDYGDSSSDEEVMPLAFKVDDISENADLSQPPKDGFEYLQRVRLEAKQCPKVVVAKNIDLKKLASNQTKTWLPPQVATCPTEYLPSTEWQKDFIQTFTDLRKVYF